MGTVSLLNTYKTPQLNKYSNIGRKTNINQEGFPPFFFRVFPVFL